MKIPEMWTAIAVEANGKWNPVDDAVMTVKEAQELVDAGLLLMAQRRRPSLTAPGPMEIVVKERRR